MYLALIHCFAFYSAPCEFGMNVNAEETMLSKTAGELYAFKRAHHNGKVFYTFTASHLNIYVKRLFPGSNPVPKCTHGLVVSEARYIYQCTCPQGK